MLSSYLYLNSLASIKFILRINLDTFLKLYFKPKNSFQLFYRENIN